MQIENQLRAIKIEQQTRWRSHRVLSISTDNQIFHVISPATFSKLEINSCWIFCFFFSSFFSSSLVFLSWYYSSHTPFMFEMVSLALRIRYIQFCAWTIVDLSLIQWFSDSTWFNVIQSQFSCSTNGCLECDEWKWMKNEKRIKAINACGKVLKLKWTLFLFVLWSGTFETISTMYMNTSNKTPVANQR